MKNGIWSNSEVKELFNIVEQTKHDNMPLRRAFSMHAEKYSRMPNSVRNYYYHEIDNLKNDEKRAKKLGIDISKHQKNNIQYFSQQEEERLLASIDNLVRGGCSVRKACLTLSDGDVGQMLRFQNKYRNFVAKNAKQKPVASPDNVIKFTKKKSTLSDAEIQGLFLGIVRLVKKNALEEANAQMKESIDRANEQLRKTIVELSSRDKELRDLKNEYGRIKAENSRLVKEVFKRRCDKAGKVKEKLESV